MYGFDVAQAGSFSSENDWKEEIKVGDEIDCYDKAKSWYASTVL